MTADFQQNQIIALFSPLVHCDLSKNCKISSAWQYLERLIFVLRLALCKICLKFLTVKSLPALGDFSDDSLFCRKTGEICYLTFDRTNHMLRTSNHQTLSTLLVKNEPYKVISNRILP